MASTDSAAPFAETIESLTGITPADTALYRRALQHRSLQRERPDEELQSNERLEFLGDSILGFVAAEHLYRAFPERDEGFLTRLRSKLVSKPALVRNARHLDLGPHLIMSANMEQSGGRNHSTILSDAYEALIGALYLDHGLEAARSFVERTALEPFDLLELAEETRNYKSRLLEFAQARSWEQPVYQILEESGPSHARVFEVEVRVGSHACGEGRGTSKKQAEQRAAREALETLTAAEGLNQQE